MEDVGKIPDIRRTIVNGTDEEFNVCVEDVISSLRFESRLRQSTL